MILEFALVGTVLIVEECFLRGARAEVSSQKRERLIVVVDERIPIVKNVKEKIVAAIGLQSAWKQADDFVLRPTDEIERSVEQFQ